MKGERKIKKLLGGIRNVYELSDEWQLEVPSYNNPSNYHFVSVKKDGSNSLCDCIGFSYRRDCLHVKAARAFLKI